MPLLTTDQEYQAVRAAIQQLTASGQAVVSMSFDGVTVSYAANQLAQLREREKELAQRLSRKNKRVLPDFSY